MVHIAKEIDYIKYCSIPFNAAYQVYRLTKAIEKIDHSRETPCPLFIALSYDDKIVSSPTTIKYFQGYTNPKNKMLLYTSVPHAFDDPRILSKNSIYPKWHIENFSHISIPISLDNFHYGKNGDYPLASHVEQDNPFIYCELNKPSRIYYDVLYKLHLTHYQRQRLTFNPDFAFMMQEIDTFIKAQGS